MISAMRKNSLHLYSNYWDFSEKDYGNHTFQNYLNNGIKTSFFGVHHFESIHNKFLIHMFFVHAKIFPYVLVIVLNPLSGFNLTVNWSKKTDCSL